MTERRVAITGLGVVAPTGVGIDPFWDALCQGRSAIRPIAGFDAGGFPATIAGELEDFSARKFVPKSYRKGVKVMARDIEMAVAAADLAVRDAGITTKGIDPDATDVDPKRLACNIGAGLICSDLNELGTAVQAAVRDGHFDMKAWGSDGINNLQPLWLLKYLPNMLACHVTIIHNARGPSNTLTCGDTSGQLAIGEAARQIARGRADVAFAGGGESKLNPMGLLRQQLLGRLCTTANDRPTEACRPFDAEHNGTVIGEGAGLVILEDLQRAEARGARIYAEVVGFGAACDPAGAEVGRANAGGLDRAARRALADAGIEPGHLGLLLAHGTGVPQEDRIEAEAWNDVLGPAVRTTPAATMTATTGSMFAGHGGVSVAATALSVYHQTVPATANFQTPDNGCHLNLSPKSRSADIDYALCGSFAVGGQSGAVVLKRYRS